MKDQDIMEYVNKQVYEAEIREAKDIKTLSELIKTTGDIISSLDERVVAQNQEIENLKGYITQLQENVLTIYGKLEERQNEESTNDA